VLEGVWEAEKVLDLVLASVWEKALGPTPFFHQELQKTHTPKYNHRMSK
jgi:hypothetical protein